MSRSVQSLVLAFATLVLSAAARADDPESRALDAIRKHIAVLDRDDFAPGKPVCGISFAFGSVGDDELKQLAAFKHLTRLNLTITCRLLRT
jgi:hypothetical protein